MAVKPKPTKFIFVTGGVVSSIGKGLSSACLGALLEARGLRITNIKLDPYINVDPGTMSPYQHGEVFVTDDGAETDLDLGHYERFTSSVMKRGNNFTTGQVYDAVIQRERRGEYLGGTVQVIPHITDEIKAKILAAAEGVDIAIIEVAARWATSSRCRSLKRFARCGSTSAGATRSTSTSPCCPTSRRRAR